MGAEAIVFIIGPIAATVLGTAAFFQRRTISSFDAKMGDISDQLEEVYEQVTTLRVALPEKYVSKEDFLHHVRTEEHWQEEVLRNMRELREEVIVLRVQGHSGGRNANP